VTQALVNVPAKAKRGEVIEIKTLISHPMETGYRHDTNGASIPRGVIELTWTQDHGDPVTQKANISVE